jgi:phenylpyruvate tautomerase PptA (4-oxalocrotonate tautomerase family)
VHEALVETFQVPPDDVFHLITRHAQGGLICTPEFLGVRHSEQALFVQIACSPGRTLQQKRALYMTIVNNIHAATGLDKRDVIINLVETLRENWSFGEGLAHYTL